MMNDIPQPGEGAGILLEPGTTDLYDIRYEGTPIQPLPSQIQTPNGGVSPIRRCPTGYRLATVENGQTFTDLLIENDVSYQAMRAVNPNLPTTRLAPGKRYCVPPSMSRRLCPSSSSSSYVMGVGETLFTVARTLGVSPGALLATNTALAPSDFKAGRVICVP